jgi:ubiquitin-activating enzyme E1
VLALKNETFFNSYMNLAVPLWVFSEPMPPIEHKDKAYDSVFRGPLRAVPPKYTCWDKIELAGPLTIEQLNAHFMAAYKVDLSIATVDKVCIYNKYDPNSKKNLG